MNRLFTLSLVIVGFMLTTVTLEATECGGVYYYFSQSETHPIGTDDNDPTGAVIAAFQNCCAGTSITTYDVDTSQSQTFPIDENGPNSSCAPE